MSADAAETVVGTHTGPEPTVTLEQIRLAQAKRLGRLVLVFVLVPTLLTLLYDVAIASKQYVSETTVTLDAGVGTEPATVGSPLARDVLMLDEYLESRALVRDLVAHHGLRDHYASAGVDALSRLSRDASDEAVFAHFDDHLDVDFDPERAFITVRVRAFRGAEAERIAQAIVALGRAYVDGLVRERRAAALAVATRDAEEAAQKLGDARAALATLAPPVAPEGAPAATSPALERARATLELAQGRFEATARSLDEARLTASRLERRTVVVTPATRPDRATLPRPIRDTFTVFLGTLALLVIGSIIVSTIKEHV